uniref:RING-type domain-containing protein n=1 Tax=Caenorhabditis tropicalis TaxID=1561998 RepID=A0A1I7UC38_9PELO
MLIFGTPQAILLGIFHWFAVDDVNWREKNSEFIIRLLLGFMVNPVIVLNWTIPKYDFYLIDIRNGNKKQEEQSIESESEDSSDEEDVESSYNQLKCRICLEDYSSSGKKRIPRIIRECGHTVCHMCAKQLWLQNKTYIECPFCKRKTYELKGVKKLGKNYAFIGIMEELKLKEKQKKQKVS